LQKKGVSVCAHMRKMRFLNWLLHRLDG